MLKLPDKEISFWRSSAGRTDYPALDSDLEVDTVIVGAGLSGLNAAYLLMKAGQKVAVIDKYTVGAGTSGHTTGKVTSQHNLIYEDMRSRLGETAARVYGQANQQALETIAKLVKAEKISCGFTRAANYVFTADAKRVIEFRREAETAARLGLPAAFTTDTSLPFKVKAAIRFNNQAYMNTQAYLDGLAAIIKSSGGFIFENTRALSIHDGRRPKVRTAHGTIHAKDIIVATNVPTFPLAARGTYCAMEYPHKSYIVACQAKNYPKGMYISPDDAHYSILPINYKRQKLLLIGGSNHIPGLGFGKDRHFETLAKYAQAKFGATSVEYKWSARDYMAYDSLPLVGKVYPWSKHLYTVTAFRKWGLTNSMAAAEILRGLIMGDAGQAAEIFSPHRLSAVKSIPHTIAQVF